MTAAATCEPVPWANGGGTTRELASRRARHGATGPGFDWRLSLADIDREGPFSALPGVDRCFAPIEGEVVLAFPGGARLLEAAVLLLPEGRGRAPIDPTSTDRR